MKKIIIGLLVIFAIALVYFLLKDDNNIEIAPGSNLSENTQESSMSSNDFSSEEFESGTYEISEDSTVSYTAQKEFFSKPTEPVTGTTGDISGELTLDKENEKISINAEINPQTLESGSGNRDDYVRSQFTSSILVNVNEADFTFENSSFTAPVELTINDINRTVDFEITPFVSDAGELSFRGSTNINMNEFNIEPASLINVYTVDEVAEISFNIILDLKN